jgi:hypothetical protein
MIFNLQSWFWVLRKGSYKVQCHFPSGAHFTCFIYWALRIMVFFLKILSCVLQIDFLQQYFGILSYNFTYEWHTGYWAKIWSHIRSIKSISGDVKDSIYCEHHVKSVLHLIGMDQIKFCIRTCGIHFTFMFQRLTELVQWLRWEWRWRMRLSSSPLRCSMGIKSGDFEGHGNTLLLFWVMTSMITLAVNSIFKMNLTYAFLILQIIYCNLWKVRTRI